MRQGLFLVGIERTLVFDPVGHGLQACAKSIGSGLTLLLDAFGGRGDFHLHLLQLHFGVHVRGPVDPQQFQRGILQALKEGFILSVCRMGRADCNSKCDQQDLESVAHHLFPKGRRLSGSSPLAWRIACVGCRGP